MVIAHRSVLGITLSLTGIYMECPAKMTVFGWIPVPGRHGVNRLQVVTSRVIFDEYKARL